MERCDVLIVGGGPAGSSCALGLRGSGLDVVVLDHRPFPRDKVCAGWVTPQVLEALGISAGEYARRGVIQPIHGFRLSRADDREVEVDHGETVSYGIRRCEFDDHLLRRSGAKLRLGEPVREMRRENGRWVVNGGIEARTLVGAGGHFCPVARLLGADPGRGEPTVLAREIEFEMTPEQQDRCPVRGEIPELFFERDLKGYGWVVRKGAWLNVGLGRQDADGFPRRVGEFLEWLDRRGRIPPDLPPGLKGHAYLLYEQAPRPIGGDGVLLAGDAMGLAYNRSGEGIRPAVESGLIAARILGETGGCVDGDALARYQGALTERFGRRYGRVRPGPTDWLPGPLRGPVAGLFLGSSWFARRIVVDRWFLHRHEPPISPPVIPSGAQDLQAIDPSSLRSSG